MRLVLSDREVPPEALAGIAFPPVWGMARDGAVRGLMIEFDPADRNSLSVTVLDKPADPQESLSTMTLSGSADLWARLTSTPTRLTGEFGSNAARDISFSFSAPVFHNRVEADLTGAAARDSPLVHLLRARFEAMMAGDWSKVAALSPAGKAIDPASFSGELMTAMRAAIPDMIEQLATVQRVVVRESTAVALLPDGSWSNFIREGGEWKVAD
jgi:hypothetical protein